MSSCVLFFCKLSLSVCVNVKGTAVALSAARRVLSRFVISVGNR